MVKKMQFPYYSKHLSGKGHLRKHIRTIHKSKSAKEMNFGTILVLFLELHL